MIYPGGKESGTGLGLSICKQFVQLMDGSIGVYNNQDGPGTTFWFEITLQHGLVQKIESAPKINVLKTQNAKILVVEDNRVNQQIALEVLSNLGYTPYAVGNGLEALDALRTASFDLILMDCQMPEMDGFKATTVIRQSESLKLRTIPIVAMTANAMNGDRERCLEVGMNDYITKPIDENKLIQAIETWLDKDKDASAPIDLTVIKNLRKLQKPDRPDLVSGLVELYLETAQEILVEIRRAIQNADLIKISEYAHSLKSSAANLGAIKLAETCLILEKISNGDLPIDQLASASDRFETDFIQAAEALAQINKAA